MEIFLKKYSDVPNGFIEDFFNIAKEYYDDSELSIDFNVVIKWLNVTKGNLKRLLIKHFTEKYDYIIDKIKEKNKNGNGAHYYENIWITPDCFKEICMLSLVSKGKLIRQYYLSIEKLIKKYHYYIEDQLYKKINLLEKNQKPKINIKGGIIYFFKALNQIKIDDLEDLYKIGETENVKNRFKNYNSGLANNIEPLFILEVNNLKTVENCIKNLLREYQYRKYKEIYQINVDALKLVFFNCDKLVNGFKNYMERNNQKIVNEKLKKMRHSKHGLILYLKKNKK